MFSSFVFEPGGLYLLCSKFSVLQGQIPGKLISSAIVHVPDLDTLVHFNLICPFVHSWNNFVSKATAATITYTAARKNLNYGIFAYISHDHTLKPLLAFRICSVVSDCLSKKTNSCSISLLVIPHLMVLSIGYMITSLYNPSNS